MVCDAIEGSDRFVIFHGQDCGKRRPISPCAAAPKPWLDLFAKTVACDEEGELASRCQPALQWLRTL